MTAKKFIFYAMIVQIKNVVHVLYFYCSQIFDSINIMRIPFQSKPLIRSSLYFIVN